MLQATKLTPDTTLVFADKASLYRSSKRRILPVYRRIGWGAAAAAVVAGLIIWLLPAGQQPGTSPAIANADKPAVTAPAPANKPANTTPATTTASPEVAVPVTVPDASSLASNDKTVTAPGSNASNSKPVTQSTDALLLAKNSKAARVKKPAAPEPTLAATTPKADAPVISQLPPQRNSMSEVVEQHQQQQANVAIAAVHPEIKEPVMAAAKQVSDYSNTNKVTPVTEQPGVPGELIMSVSGSDSRILDKVTNVAKFFSRKRNK